MIGGMPSDARRARRFRHRSLDTLTITVRRDRDGTRALFANGDRQAYEARVARRAVVRDRPVERHAAATIDPMARSPPARRTLRTLTSPRHRGRTGSVYLFRNWGMPCGLILTPTDPL